jgi:hypothetical protein
VELDYEIKEFGELLGIIESAGGRAEG